MEPVSASPIRWSFCAFMFASMFEKSWAGSAGPETASAVGPARFVSQSRTGRQEDLGKQGFK